jgi:hypothetical protein
MINRTINQHYISQSEQRLNAINPNANSRKQKIYQFKIENRDLWEVSLVSHSGVKIANNLSDTDLYSYHLLNDGDRENFEALFDRYESKIDFYTKELLSKVEKKNTDISIELREIFISKFMSLLRNPHNIKLTLNIFDRIVNCFPTEPSLNKVFDNVENGYKPQIKILAGKYSVTEEEYRNWLKVLYLSLAVKDDNNANILESIANGFFTDPANMITVFLSIYSDASSVLISDRGYSQLDNNPNNIYFDFNLTSEAFASFIFVNMDLSAPSFFGGNEDLASRVATNFKKIPQHISLNLLIDNQEVLTAYNSRVIFQSKEFVYCKYKDIKV